MGGRGLHLSDIGLVVLADARQYSILPRDWPPDDESLTLHI